MSSSAVSVSAAAMAFSSAGVRRLRSFNEARIDARRSSIALRFSRRSRIAVICTSSSSPVTSLR
jgi:hypothetical protein